MARYGSGVTALVALGLVSACTGAVSTQRDLNYSYNYQNFSKYHQGKDTRVIIRGDTFGLDPEAFAQRVTDAMQGAHAGPPTHFTTQPGPSAPGNFRVVMAFNVPDVHYGLCEGYENMPVHKVEGETTLQAAWCWDNSTESYVRAWTIPVEPSDPKFRELVAQTTYELFPPHMDKYLIRDDGDDDPPA